MKGYYSECFDFRAIATSTTFSGFSRELHDRRLTAQTLHSSLNGTFSIKRNTRTRALRRMNSFSALALSAPARIAQGFSFLLFVYRRSFTEYPFPRDVEVESWRNDARRRLWYWRLIDSSGAGKRKDESRYIFSQEYGCHVIGADLSTNMLDLSLRRLQETQDTRVNGFTK